MAIIQELDVAIIKRNSAIHERSAAIQERDAAVRERNAAIQERDAAIQERDAAARLLVTTKEGYENSHSWRITAPLRRLFSAGKAVKNALFDGLSNVWSMGKKLLSWLSIENMQRVRYYTKQHGIRQTLRRVAHEFRPAMRGQQVVIMPPPPIAEPAQPVTGAVTGVRAIAFYLPQFHPIPENDRWWGEGFTEWTNVSKAKPVFAGHLQPKLPGPLGFYDLRLPEIMRKQAAMAKKFGIHGFCFHYYWFGGKRLLERPLEQLLADTSLDLPFCLCWANENWTRRWDGHESEVLIAQQHSEEDDRAVMRDILRHMADPRYIRVEGRPVLLIYRASLFPDIQATFGRWREVCAAHGEQAPFFVMAQSFENRDPSPMGFDAAVQFPPHLPGGLLPYVNLADAVPEFAGEFIDYDDTVKAMLAACDPSLPTYPCVFPAWDNTARRGFAASIVINGSPEKYEDWLRDAVKLVRDNFPRERAFVFINAWNEWAEGAYLEPDRDYGYAYLNATSRALVLPVDARDCIAPEHRLRVLFISHDACLAGAQVLLLHTMRWLKRHAAVDFSLLLLGDGVLREAYEEICPVLLCPDGKVTRQGVEAFFPCPDVVCGNSAVSAQCYDALVAFDVPIVTYVHEMEAALKRWVSPDTLTSLIKNCSYYVATSAPVRDNLITAHGILPEKITVIDSFLEPTPEIPFAQKETFKKELGLPQNGKLIVGCGTRDWRKGPDLFVETARRVLGQTKEPVHFCWIGGGTDPSIPDPEVLAKRYGIANTITFTEHIPNPEAYFQAADIFLLTSREDPFPLVALGACAASTPVICFDGAGGMPEFIRSGAGVVVPYEDVAAMAEKTLDLIHDSHALKKLGESARARLMEAHTADIAVPHLLEILREVAQKPHPVSVVVPNYNYAHYLPERMKSIFEQSFRDAEVIILDDASTDNSLEVIERWKTRAAVRVIINEANSGNANLQWKKGMEQARGKFIWIAEADDTCAPDFLAHLLRPLQKDGVTFAYSIPSVIDAEGQTAAFAYQDTYLDIPGKERWSADYTTTGEDEAENALGILNCIPNVSAAVFCAPKTPEAIDAACRFRYAGDWMFYLHLAKAGKVAYVHGDFARHRRHGGSIIATDAKKKHASLLREVKQVHAWVRENFSVDEECAAKMQLFITRFFPQ